MSFTVNNPKWYPFEKDDDYDEEEEVRDINEIKKEISEKSFNNDYTVYRLCGSGSFASTYLCKIQGLRHYFAVKILNVKNEKMTEKDSLDIQYHRNVVTILSDVRKVESIDLTKLPDYESFWKEEMGRIIYTNLIVMKEHRMSLNSYLKQRMKKNVVDNGESTIDRLNSVDQWKRVTNLSIETCRMLKGLLFGVRHLHEHGIVHRDLHDGNVFVFPEKGRIWVGDFGCHINIRNNDNGFKVRKDDSNLISVGYSSISGYENIGGARMFLPPEIIDNNDILDYEKCDLFSVGMLGYRIISVLFGDGSFFPFGDFVQGGKKVPIKVNRKEYKGFPDEFFGIDKGVSGLIRDLLEIDASKRIGFIESCESISSLTVLLEYKLKVIFEETPENISFLSIGGEELTKWLEEQQPREYKNLCVYFKRGRECLRRNDCKEAIGLFQKSLVLLQEKFHKRRRDIAVTRLYLAISKRKVGEFEGALDDLSKSLKFWASFKNTEEEEENENMAKCILQMGVAHFGLKEIKKAVECFERSLEFFYETRRSSDEIRYYLKKNFHFLALIYENSDLKKAIEFHVKCFDMDMKESRFQLVSKRLIRITRYLCKNRKFEEAYRFAEEVLERLTKLESSGEQNEKERANILSEEVSTFDITPKVKCYQAMGEGCVQMFKRFKEKNINWVPTVSKIWWKRLRRGKEYFGKVLESIPEKHPEVRKISLDLAVVHELLKENDEALMIFKKYRDELGIKRVNRQIQSSKGNAGNKGIRNYKKAKSPVIPLGLLWGLGREGGFEEFFNK